jgi:hypothetical protein
MAFSTRPNWTRSRIDGGYEVATAGETTDPRKVLWTARALPSVVALTGLPTDLVDPGFALPPLPLDSGVAGDGVERLVELDGVRFRVHLDPAGTDPPAVLLPLDRLFEVRAAAAIRLWRGLTGRKPGPDFAALSKARRDRLIFALRALDAREEHASYREIASVLFAGEVVDRGWKTHDLRDRTIRLARYGVSMMKGGYRQLLLQPYRRRS